MLNSLRSHSRPRHFFIRCAVAGLLAIATNGSPLAETSQRRADNPLPHQLREIAKWIAENSELPANFELPRISFMPRAQLASVRFGGFVAAERNFAASDQAAQTTSQREVLALYHNASKTIFLAKGWTGSGDKEISVLVHEMVHHLQNVGEVSYPCPQAREKPAYLMQAKWLEQHGLDLGKEFDIDDFTIAMTSMCGY